MALGHFLLGRGAERAAGGSQHDLFHRAAVAIGERLENRVVLRIDRQQCRAGRPHRAQHHVAGAHQGFLVGQADVAAAADRREGGRQAGGAGDRSHGPIRLQRSRRDDGIGAGSDLDPGAGEGITQRGIGGVVGDNGDLGTQRDRLFGQQNRVAASHQGSTR